MRNGILLFSLLFVGLHCSRKNTPAREGLAFGLPENICIDSTLRRVGPCEPSIAISPADPRQVVAGAILDNAYVSSDGGRSWTQQTLESPFGVFGDPVLLADFEGRFFYAHLSDPSGRGWADPSLLDRIVVQRSTDGGRSWSEGSFTGHRPPKDQDKHWLAVDPRNQHLYCSWTEFDEYGSSAPEDRSRILFSKSTDHGQRWSEPIVLSEKEGNCLDGDQTTEGAVPAVGPEGQVYVAWSFDEAIYFDRSTDGGRTWLEEDSRIADQPGGWAFDIPGLGRANGMPITAVDLSKGPHRGTVYVNWADQRHGESDTDVWLIRSEDGGTSWSQPLRVNDDPPGKHQFFTWMTVDPTDGAIYIVFYDRRAYEDAQTDVFLAWSTDGGRSFTNRKISQSPFHPVRGIFFGDYNHISAYGGQVRPIWTRADGLRLSVWTALLSSTGLPQQNDGP